MLENIILAFIVLCCAFFIGRKFYRQWRAAMRADQDPPCNCCSGCSITACADRNPLDKELKG